MVPAAPPQRQRGAAAVFGAVALVAALIAMLLGINIGMLYYAQRNLQKLAVVSALAGAQASSGCRNGGVLGDTTAVTARVQSALTSNGGATSLLQGFNSANPVELGWVNSSSGQALTDSSGKITYTAPADGLRHFYGLSDGDARINSVRVNLSQASPTLLGGGLLPGAAPVTLKASATAEQQAIGSFYLGTSLLSLNTANSALLNPLLQALLCGGSSNSSCNAQVALVVASYQGLANADISLGDLLGSAVAANVGIQDLSSLLTTKLTLPQWLGILGTTLGNTVDGTTGQVSNGVSGLVQGLAGMADSSGGGFDLGTVLNEVGLDLNPAVSGVVGAVPFVDGLDLLAALGEAAQASPNGSVKPITLPITLDIPGVASVNTYLSIGAPPKFAIGPAGAAKASTAEITLMVRISGDAVVSALTSLVNTTVNGVLQLVGILSLGLIQSTVTVLPTPLHLGIDVNVAPATASLDKLQCPTDATAAPVAGLSGTTAITTLNVGPFIGNINATPTPLSAANTYEWTLAEVKVNASALGLGSTDTQVILGLVSVGVGVTPINFQDVTQFIVPPTGNPPSYVAYGAPSYPAATNGDNPQTVGSNLGVSLSLTVYPKVVSGSGLLGVLSNLVSTLVTALKGLLNALLSLVNGLLASIVNPLLNLLGIQLGSATLIMNSVTVAPPVIVSTALP
jgi:uncharacterized membrane protein